MAEYDYCPKCSGDLDTGYECNNCGFDFMPFIKQHDFNSRWPHEKAIYVDAWIAASFMFQTMAQFFNGNEQAAQNLSCMSPLVRASDTLELKLLGNHFKFKPDIILENLQSHLRALGEE